MKNALPMILFLVIILTACNYSSTSQTSEEKLSIHDIQGCDHLSPYTGKAVNDVKGIVTWKVGDGFFIQEETPDNKDCSSEGIFVFTQNYVSAIPGDRVSVSGTVKEFYPGQREDANLSVTEILAEEVIILSGYNEIPDPIIIGKDGKLPPDEIIEDDQLEVFDPTRDGLDFYESLEGMKIEISNALVVQPTNGYNELFVIPSELIYVNLLSKSGALVSKQDDMNPERILVNLPDNYRKSITLGDQFTEPIIGVLDYEFGNYRLLETNVPALKHHQSENADISTSLTTGELRIATYNINNFNRFANDKLDGLTDQIENNLGAPDIIVFQEVQDDSGVADDGVTSASKNLNSLISKIYDNYDILYRFVDSDLVNNSSGGIPGGNIRTVILYRIDRGLELKETDFSWLPNYSSAYTNSRKPLIAEFSFADESFYVIGVHLVSNNLNTPLFGIVQPPQKPEEHKRIEQAQWIANAVVRIQEQNENSSILVVGDFNDVPWSDTLSQFGKTGLVNLMNSIAAEERYSILYEGNGSLFDQVLVSGELSDYVVRENIVHINTINAENKQISDHDPIIVDFRFK